MNTRTETVYERIAGHISRALQEMESELEGNKVVGQDVMGLRDKLAQLERDCLWVANSPIREIEAKANSEAGAK